MELAFEKGFGLVDRLVGAPEQSLDLSICENAGSRDRAFFVFLPPPCGEGKGLRRRHVDVDSSAADIPGMAVLLLGSTGFIGPRIVHALEALGVEVVAASRGGHGPNAVALDRGDVAQVRALVRERRIHAVVDLLAFTEADTLPLLDALDGQVERWVMASSCDVYRNYEGLQRKAGPDPLLEPATEASPLRTTRHPYRTAPPRARDATEAWMDDYDKIPLEEALRARPGLSGVILRLPMVFGPGDRQQRFRWITAPMQAGKAQLAVNSAWAGWRTTYGYVDDVAHALAAASRHPAAAGRTFNLGELNAPDHMTWIGRFAGVLGWRGDVVEAPATDPLAALDLSYPMVCDTSAFRNACGWREPTAPEEALLRTAADEQRRQGSNA
ncbi:NAD-dependent epimerase/dehydratase family protein [Phenylobacterium sp.]|uniref:NAD-dependent epimerase/dehydratase family protein n=1 Tax=Phenylobacterium sp. TaxID=1871053 RepID=UPI002732E322|nr:NAD-dependent epimerase/dehydratase family protein [Phenylobacterium sp.]MDP3852844.1 NAD-dependent epimerase/dehydratase family protein [Phenylobacterium sp.]